MEKYDPKKIEPAWYSVWEKNKYFHADENSDKPPFVIVIPPPNVTGSLHMGHALNNTLQDILARHKRASGFNVLWLPGCDHAGIATQNVVEKELRKEGKTRHELGRARFEEKVWEWKEKYGAEIMMQLRKLGSSLDWDRERFTMDAGLSEAVKEVFVKLYKEGLIYRGDYIINWCPRCRTALSDIETGHREIDGHFYHLRYPFADDPEKFIEVATTRPETMLGDTAVAVNPKDERYSGIKEGTEVILPETGRTIPVIKDDYVDMEFGTGAVKITPGHDPNDFEIGMRHKLEIINILNEDGTMNENAGENGGYEGLDRFECRKKITAVLKEKGFLTDIEDHKHAVGHCYRCDTIIEPYVSTQWFVKIGPMAQPAIDIVKKGGVKFVPQMWEKVYYEWMYNIKDWCISRQLWWGHRIPAYYCSCGEMTVSKEPPSECPKCGSAGLTQDEDVLDTWFSSALWPFSTLGWPEQTKDLQVFYPTSVLVTSWDILFFWVARMIMSGMKFMKEPPFHTVVINSLVCDEHGKKMSKSTGNVVDPLDIIKDYSADALRFTMASLETQTRHIAFSEERLKGYSNFMNKIWNASRFVISHLEDYEPVDLVKEKDKLKLPEKWILAGLMELNEKITAGLDSYKFAETALAMYDFFWHSFCDWYIEAAKIELFKEDPEYKPYVKTVLAKVLHDSMILLHPVVPFITEEIYSFLPLKDKKESIMLESMPAVEKELCFETDEMDMLMDVIYHIRNIRGELTVPPGKKAEIYVNIKEAGIITRNEELLKVLAKASGVHTGKKPPETAAGKDVEGLGYIGIDVKGAVEADKEIEKTEKKIEKLRNGINAINKKLSNEKFTANAPVKVIEGEKAKLEKYTGEIKQLEEIKNKLERLR